MQDINEKLNKDRKNQSEEAIRKFGTENLDQ